MSNPEQNVSTKDKDSHPTDAKDSQQGSRPKDGKGNGEDIIGALPGRDVNPHKYRLRTPAETRIPLNITAPGGTKKLYP